MLYYPSFSIRLSFRDIPKLGDVLRSISDNQWSVMQSNLLATGAQLLWEKDGHGGAYDTVLRSIRRRVWQMFAHESYNFF